MKVLGIIPARAGSKGIKDKNVFPICGKPLIGYTIEAALKAKLLYDLIVSSDDTRIEKIASEYGVNFILREKKYAQDDTTISSVVKNILENNPARFNKNIDAIMLLQPTSPIREPYHIDDCIELLTKNSEANSVVSVCEMNEIHPARMYNFEAKYLTPLEKKYETTRRQKIPPVYYRNGSVYLVRSKAFEQENSFMIKPLLPYIMPKKYLLNIDEKLDLLFAKTLISAWLNNELNELS